MTTLQIAPGPDQGPAGTATVRLVGAKWPLVSGSGRPGSPNHMIAPSTMEGCAEQGVPADPRLSSWPTDLVELLRVVHQACEPIDYLPVYMGATIPAPDTLSVAYMRLDPGTDYVAKLASAYQAAGYKVVLTTGD